jgi:hypothetical protein
MKIALALLLLTGATAAETYRSVRHPTPKYELHRCHWDGGHDSCNHIFAELRENWKLPRWKYEP